MADESSAHLEGSVLAEPTEPSTEPIPDFAAHTSLPAGGAADRGAEADALLGSREVTKKKKRASDSQVVASHIDPAIDSYSDYVTVSSMDVAKFQTQGYMSCNLIGDNCPLDCDMLVFPVPIGKQWACAVVDMRERSITYGSSSKVLVRQSNALCPIQSAKCDHQLVEQHDMCSFMHPWCIQWYAHPHL